MTYQISMYIIFACIYIYTSIIYHISASLRIPINPYLWAGGKGLHTNSGLGRSLQYGDHLEGPRQIPSYCIPASVYIYICVWCACTNMYKQTVYKLPFGMLSPDTINHNSRDWNPVALHQGAAVLASANHVQILLLWWMHASEAGSFVRRKVSPRLVTSSGTWQLNRTSERMKFGWEASFFLHQNMNCWISGSKKWLSFFPILSSCQYLDSHADSVSFKVDENWCCWKQCNPAGANW